MQLEVILEEKSHSHPCLVKQRQLTSQSRRKRKAEIVSVSVSCPQIWNIQLEKDREKEKVGGEKFSCWKNNMKIL